MSDVLSIGDWNNNAELFADAHRIGYVKGAVLDLTYGVGNFWTNLPDLDVVKNDLNPEKGDHSHDVSGPIPMEWGYQFDTVVFDPPYAMSGRRDAVPGKGEGGFSANFGLDKVKDKDVPGLLRDGTRFAIECAKPSGFVLVKCQDQQWSGKLFEQTDLVRQVARSQKFRVVDRFHMRIRVRAQPATRAQVSARSNYSTLMVLGR